MGRSKFPFLARLYDYGTTLARTVTEAYAYDNGHNRTSKTVTS